MFTGRRKKSSSKKGSMLLLEEMIESMDGICDPIHTFSSKELERATNNYDSLHLSRNDGWYSWYKGSLDGRFISIRKANDDNSRLQLDRVINDLVISVQMNANNNFLKLIGICLQTRVPIMVYEFAENGTLSDCIHNSNATPLSWRIRLKIATEIASTIAYLHTVSRRPIVLRDLQTSNVFLDRQYTAKLSDLSLSISIRRRGEARVEHDTCGTFGFLPPETLTRSLVSEKGDVFSFGALVLELLTGEKAYKFYRLAVEDDVSLLEYLRNHLRSNNMHQILNPRIQQDEGGLDDIQRQMQAVAELGLRCIKTNMEERPTMLDVVNQLKQIVGLSPYNYGQALRINWEIRYHLAMHSPPIHEKQNLSRLVLSRFKKPYLKSRSVLLLKEAIDSCNLNGDSIRSFSAKELEQATNKYNFGEVIHRDGYHTWYRGYLHGQFFAVKKAEQTASWDLDDAINELVIALHMNAHENVLKLIGVCLETKFPTVVHEFAENGRLDQYLWHNHNQAPCPYLPWESRLRIASGIAKAIAYLHTAFNTPIIHRDVNPSNVFLDKHDSAKLSGFKLSIPILEGETWVQDYGPMVRGTLGYISPEYPSSFSATEKNDVYSFGVLLLVLLTGHSAVDISRLAFNEDCSLLDYFRNYVHRDEITKILDPRTLRGEPRVDMQHVQAVSWLVLRCMETNVEERPSMPNVARQLEQVLEEANCVSPRQSNSDQWLTDVESVLEDIVEPVEPRD